MDLQTVAILGVIVSLIMAVIKKYVGTKELLSKAIVVALSIIGGAVYWFLKDTASWQMIVGILAVASTVYAFFLKK